MHIEMLPALVESLPCCAVSAPRLETIILSAHNYSSPVNLKANCRQEHLPLFLNVSFSHHVLHDVLQEHVLLLRSLVQAVPGSFIQLQGLTDSDPEADFFHNVAHLQLHRRSRALARLSKVLP